MKPQYLHEKKEGETDKRQYVALPWSHRFVPAPCIKWYACLMAKSTSLKWYACLAVEPPSPDQAPL
jgi:hypothetical protein